jgi:antitoxin PrlF
MKTIISEKGQITIPKKIRNTMGLAPGMELEVNSSKGQIIITKKIAVDAFTKWRGKLKLPAGNNVDDYINRVRG